MQQPPGFVHSQFPTHVCKLHRAIYELRQAPWAWYNELRRFLVLHDFQNSKSDSSLFIHHGTNFCLYLLVYVDDIVVTGSSEHKVHDFISLLSNRFSLKDLGSLSYFLEVEAQQCTQGLFLSQRKYICDLLKKTNMHDVKEVSSPLVPSLKLTFHDSTPSTGATLYRQVLGSMQYLSLTRPDISFIVNKLSQYMHQPTVTH